MASGMPMENYRLPISLHTPHCKDVFLADKRGSPSTQREISLSPHNFPCFHSTQH